jgi:hypothetical protein
MKPYKDENCGCYKLYAGINAQCPHADWDADKACSLWLEKSKDLKNNDIEFEPDDYDNWGCTCPTCGRMICGLCV